MLTHTLTDPDADSPLLLDLEARLEQARPRLLRLARAFHIPADAADDIAQETIIHAWRRLEQLRSAERFDAWLDAICRRQCQMYGRRHRAAERRHAGNAPAWEEDDANRGDFTDASRFSASAEQEPEWLADPQADDPWDALERSELALLLDRALGYLAPQARAALELRYLLGLSTAEAAEALHVSAQALDMRLYRARSQLRKTLAGPLREEVAAFGLGSYAMSASSCRASDGAVDGWQETRITCYLCGRRRLVGRFERLAGGREELRLRCPACSRQHGVDVFRSKGIALLGKVRSFRPALTRAMRALADRARRSLTTGSDVCLHCGQLVQRQLVWPDAYPTALPQTMQRHWLVAPCGRLSCSGLGPWPAVEAALWFDPAARQFMARHRRWILLPEEVTDWQGRSVIRCGLGADGGRAQLILLVDAHTLRPLAHY